MNYIYMHSKADLSQLSLQHETKKTDNAQKKRHWFESMKFDFNQLCPYSKNFSLNNTLCKCSYSLQRIVTLDYCRYNNNNNNNNNNKQICIAP